MSEGFAVLAAVLLLVGLGFGFYATFRNLWQREQEYKAQRLAERLAAGLPPPTRADRIRESVGAVLAAGAILGVVAYFGQGGHPSHALLIALPIVYGWRSFHVKRKARDRGSLAEIASGASRCSYAVRRDGPMPTSGRLS